MTVNQKLGVILENKMVQKLKLEISGFSKKWSPKLKFLNEKMGTKHEKVQQKEIIHEKTPPKKLEILRSVSRAQLTLKKFLKIRYF